MRKKWLQMGLALTAVATVTVLESACSSLRSKVATAEQPVAIPINPKDAQNIAIVQRFLTTVVNNGEVDKISEFWTTDMRWHGGSLGEFNGLETYTAFTRANVGKAFTDMHLTVKDIFAVDGKVVARFTNSGKNTGSFMNIAPTNRRAKWEGIGIYQIRDGKIAEAWFVEDIYQMLDQLKVVHVGTL